jgi:hypothetical protein
MHVKVVSLAVHRFPIWLVAGAANQGTLRPALVLMCRHYCHLDEAAEFLVADHPDEYVSLWRYLFVDHSAGGIEVIR